MLENNQNPPATVPAQREATAPVRKSMPVVIALVVIVALIGIANVSSLMSGKKKAAPASALPMRPAAPNAQQISSFETQQQMQAQQDADARQRQQQIAAAMQQLQAAQDVPGPESAGAPPMTAAQRVRDLRRQPDAPQHTSNVSQAQAEAKATRAGTGKAAPGCAEQRYRRDRLRASDSRCPECCRTRRAFGDGGEIECRNSLDCAFRGGEAGRFRSARLCTPGSELDGAVRLRHLRRTPVPGI